MAKNEDFLDAANADVIADMISDPDTPDTLRVKMINKLLEARRSDNFFVTMLMERLSFGACRECGHNNHWLVPEDFANQIGWVSHEEDSRVKRMTTAKDCPKWQQSCKKKRVSV